MASTALLLSERVLSARQCFRMLYIQSDVPRDFWDIHHAVPILSCVIHLDLYVVNTACTLYRCGAARLYVYLAVVASLSCTCTCILHFVVVSTGAAAALSLMNQLSINRISLSARRFYTPYLLKRTFSGSRLHRVVDQSPDLYEYTSGRWLCAVPPSP